MPSAPKKKNPTKSRTCKPSNIGVPGGSSGKCPDAPKKKNPIKSSLSKTKKVTWDTQFHFKEITPIIKQSPKTYAQEQKQKQKQKMRKTPFKSKK